MSAAKKLTISPQEYLVQERRAEFKSEYLRGEVFALYPAPTWKHALIKDNLAHALRIRLKDGPCKTLTSDLRVRVERSGLYAYPDVVVVCEEPKFEDEVFDTLLNPRMIVEVLSDSTEKYDRGEKFKSYRTFASLKEYILVGQSQPLLERFVRQSDDAWLLTTFANLDAEIVFQSIDAQSPTR